MLTLLFIYRHLISLFLSVEKDKQKRKEKIEKIISKRTNKAIFILMFVYVPFTLLFFLYPAWLIYHMVKTPHWIYTLLLGLTIINLAVGLMPFIKGMENKYNKIRNILSLGVIFTSIYFLIRLFFIQYVL